MELKFWLPTVISVVAIVWAFIQSRMIEGLKNEHAKQVIVSKLQFEKEFEVYAEVWAHIVDLKSRLLAFSPEMYQIHEADEELREKSIKALGLKYLELSKVVEKNKPFFSLEIYNLLSDHIKEANSVFQWNVLNKPDQVLENWQFLETKIQKVLKSSDHIGEAIRERIGNLYV